MATTYLKETLNFLGPEYQLKYIDGEDCIYRKLSDSYDIEVSGAYKKSNSISIYIWNITRGTGYGAHIVETIHGIKSREELKTTLDSITAKYSEAPHSAE